MNEMKTCQLIRYAGLGSEQKCGNLATRYFDKGEKTELMVGDDCARYMHPSRLSPLETDAPECQECHRTESQGAELVTARCGVVLCEDHAWGHADCYKCAQKREWERADYEWSRRCDR